MKSDNPFFELPVLRISSADHYRLCMLLDSVIKEQPRLRTGLLPLRAELDRADVLPPELLPHEVVVMGSHVEIEDREAGEVDAYTLVYPEHADATAGRLSILAPIGTAIIGFKQGDSFSWQTPGGARQLLIRKVTPPGTVG